MVPLSFHERIQMLRAVAEIPREFHYLMHRHIPEVQTKHTTLGNGKHQRNYFVVPVKKTGCR